MVEFFDDFFIFMILEVNDVDWRIEEYVGVNNIFVVNWVFYVILD